ncbi:hypothetical protein [Cryobacterium fucosi]|uniref:Uncharacterized protein n=1 Tax=Cryobacterium fucosi TaxID=1259157 RepID=A0A4R9B4X4_9MICO|nr:hypothetical protein [Cryobacterium fucosi]TFD74731.1 hypothetical protein E3T48_12460 [Cryobacterium fucosi]
MKIRMLAKISGTRDLVDWPDVGGTINVPADEAQSLIENGLAAEVGAVETADLTRRTRKPETATVKGLTKRDLS